MMTLLRGLVALVLAGLAGVGLLWAWSAGVPALEAVPPPDPAGFDARQVEAGRMLAAVGDCAACHTAEGGDPFAGGRALPTPFGVIHATNITPDPATGIGGWSLEAFARAMRQGVARDGTHLYPAFPYDHFARVTDEDIAAIYAFLMSNPAVTAPPMPNAMQFPFGWRPLLAGWKLLFHDASPFAPDPALTDEQNRGKYLVEGLGHCSACHAPRNLFGAVQAAAGLAGGQAEGWHVPALGPASRAAVPWTADAYLNYLFDGWDAAHGIAAGPMTPVADGFYDAGEDDVYAIAAYLATLAPEPDAAAVAARAAEVAALDWAEDERPGGTNAPPEPDLLAGEALFAQQCAKCHKARVSDEQPASLGLAAIVTAPDARNFIHVVREGIVPPLGARQRSMPGQEVNMSDAELAQLAAFVRWRFTDLPAWPDLPGTIAGITGDAP